MAGDRQLGNIVYEVEMEVANLIEAQRQVNNRLDEMQGKFEQTGKAVGGAEKSFSSLSRVATALTAALSVQQVANYADAWTTLNNKLANSIRTGENLVSVTERVFNITQSTRSSLDATATLYARLERGTREYNTSAADLAKLTTIINQGFVVSGATAQEAENAIIQLSQGIASGVLRGEEFNSVSEQGSRLMVALADSLGVGIGELRAMAAQGKLTTDVVVNGLLGQGDVIGREFANTTQTIGQAFQVAGNNITKFVGSSTTVKAGVAIFNDAVVTLSENLDTVSTVLLSLTAIMGSRYVGALAAATAVQLSNAAAAYSNAAALGAMGAAATAARGALSLVGGPAGAAALAAAAIFYFYQKAQQAKQEANDLADSVNTLVSKFRQMSATEVGASIARMRESLGSLNDSVDEAQKNYDNATYHVRNLRKEIDNWGKGTTRGRQAADALSDAMDAQYVAAEALEKAQTRLSQTQSAITLGQAQLTSGLRTGIDLLGRESTAAGDAAGMMNHFAQSINQAALAKDKFNASSLQIQRSEKADEYNKQIEDENVLLAITDQRVRAVTRARMEAEAKGGNTNQINAAGELAAKNFDLQKAEEARNKAAQEALSAGRKAENQAESIASKLQSLKQQSELTADSTKELSREQSILRAQQSLGKGATEDQIRQAGEYAAKTFDSAKAVRDLAEAEQGRKFATQEITASLVMPDAVTGAVQSPTAQIDLQEQQKLAALAKYQEIDKQNTQIYEDAKTAIQQQAANARQQIIQNELNVQSQAISSILGSVSQGFDGLANLAAGAAGESSGAYKAMFALSKGFAVAQAALNLQLAISQAMADPTALTPAQKFANYAAIASAGASLLSSIGSIAYSGGRKNGGPVSAGSMYQVGESGLPEIYQASTGKQYMIPGDNGTVISNRELQAGGAGGGGGISMTFNFDIQTTGGIDADTQKQMAQMMQTVAIKTIQDQQRPRGLLSKTK